MKSIWIITAENKSSGYDESGSHSDNVPRNPYQKMTQKVMDAVEVGADELKNNMANFLDVVGDLFHQAENKTGMKLDEVELSVEITADGEVKLVGSGVGVEAKGAITLKFKRDENI